MNHHITFLYQLTSWSPTVTLIHLQSGQSVTVDTYQSQQANKESARQLILQQLQS